MNQDIKGQIKYLKDRTEDLEQLCRNELHEGDVSNDVKNVFQDIVIRTNRLLDIIMYDFFEREIAPQLTLEEKNIYEKKVTFPVASKPTDIKGILGQFGLKDLETRNPKLYSVIDSYQPYQRHNKWIKHLRDFSNLGHRKLIPQAKRNDKRLILGESLRINVRKGSSLNMRGCTVKGLPVHELQVDDEKVTGRLDQRLNPKIENLVTYFVEGTSVDTLSLCKHSVSKIEGLAEKFQSII